MEYSTLQSLRYAYQPKVPKMLRAGIKNIGVTEGKATESASDEEKISSSEAYLLLSSSSSFLA